MKTIHGLLVATAVLLGAASALAQDVWNPATGVYIMQKGDLYQGDTTKGDLFYTLYGTVPNQVKRVTFRYNGLGYFRLENKTIVATTTGADGVIHHPDGDLLIGAQGKNVHKVNKTTGTVVTTVTDSTGKAGQDGIYHLMMDPSNNILWAAGIPGQLFQFSTTDVQPNHLGSGAFVQLKGDDLKVATLAWDENGQTFYTSSYSGGVGSFGTIDMTTKTTKRLYSNLSGAHGMAYDEYSKTILIFGSSRVVQIDPISRSIIATLDFNTLFSSSMGGKSFQFDQGTTDGLGHVYVADNNGYLAFIDFTSNSNKRIDNNCLIHVQYLDATLDDVAPLSGAGSERKKTVTSSGSGFSSSSISSSSNQIVSSSSAGTSSNIGSSGTTSSESGSSDAGSSGAGSSGTTSSGTASSGSTSSGATSSGATSSGGTSSGTTSSGAGSSGTGSSGGTSSNGGSSGATSSGGTSSDGGSSGATSSGGTSSDGGSSGATSSGGTSSDGGSSGATSSGGTSSDGGSSGATSSGGTSSDAGSSGGGTSGGGTSVPAGSSGGGTSGGGTSVPAGSSSGGTSGSGTAIPPWADPDCWPNCWDTEGNPIPDDSTVDNYPDLDKRKVADSVVTSGSVLVPVLPGDLVDPDSVIIVGGNRYKKSSNAGSVVVGFGPGYGSTGVRDSMPIGAVLSIAIDINKLKSFFGLNAGDSLKINGSQGLQFVNPTKGGAPGDSVFVTLDGSTGNVWVVADSAVNGGYITFVGPNGKVLRYDGVNFYDPIPFPEVGLLKDSNGDQKKDLIEVVLDRSLDTLYQVDSVQILFNGDTLTLDSSHIHFNGDRDRIFVDVEGTGLETYTVQTQDVLKTFFSDGGTVFERTMPLRNVMQGIIARAVVIHSLSGVDSLFVEFNIDISTNDLAHKNTLILLNGNEINVSVARQPGKRIVILESDSMGNFSGLDSIQLHELAAFESLEYLVEEEFGRKVPVEVINRLPAMATGSGYFDSDGDGVMDSVVFHFDGAVTPEQLAMMNFTIPWYSFRNRQIQLMPQPEELVIDPVDPSVVSWKVRSNVALRSGLTSLSAGLPSTDIFIEYPIFESYFTEHRSFPLLDLMSPAITEAKLSFSQEGDTLALQFSEVVDFEKITRKDIFKYIHGGDTLILRPQEVIWSNDGLSAKVVMWHGQLDPMIPGDLVLMRGDGVTGGMVIDGLDNVPLGDSKGVLVQGGLNQLVQSSNMGTLSLARMDSLAKLGAMSVQFMDQTVRTNDLREKGKVGQLIELGQRFLPQLVEQSGVNKDSLDPKDVSISVSTYYFDNLGQYVTDTIIVVNCNHPAFGGNCLDTDKKLFIDWNFKDARGRFVGSGIYVANFSLFVRYNTSANGRPVVIKEETIEKVGVRRSK